MFNSKDVYPNKTATENGRHSKMAANVASILQSIIPHMALYHTASFGNPSCVNKTSVKDSAFCGKNLKI